MPRERLWQLSQAFIDQGYLKIVVWKSQLLTVEGERRALDRFVCLL